MMRGQPSWVIVALSAPQAWIFSSFNPQELFLVQTLVGRSEHYRKYGHSGSVVVGQAEPQYSVGGAAATLYFFGGCGDDGRFIGDFVALDLGSKAVATVAEGAASEGRPFARHFHSAAWYGGIFYIFGGKSNGYHNDLWKIELTSSSSVPPQWRMVKALTDQAKLFARFGQSAVLWNGIMYVFGGYDQHGFCCNELHAFVFARGAWQKETKMSGVIKERYHHSAVVYGNAMYIFGGRGDSEGLGDLVEYHFDTRTWTSIVTHGVPPSKRWGHSACVIGDAMYVFGGCDGSSCFGDLHMYDFRSRQWVLVDVPHCPAPRYFQLMCVDGERLFIVGGKDLWGRCFDEVHELCHSAAAGGTSPAPSVHQLASPLQTLAVGAPSHLPPSDKMRLKLHFNEEVRLIVVPRSITFQELLGKLREQYDETISFRYTDEESDLITVRNQEDWEEALSFFCKYHANQASYKIHLDNFFSLRGTRGKKIDKRGSSSELPSARRSSSLGLPIAYPSVKLPSGEVSPQALISPPNSSGRSQSAIGAASPAPVLKVFSASRWKRGEIIGSGAFGDVYKVMHVDTGELAAVKVVRLNPNNNNNNVNDNNANLNNGAKGKEGAHKVRNAVASLMRELSLMQDLAHPNIVSYLGSEDSGETLQIFMEYVPGGSIASMLQRFGKFPERVVCNFTKQILQGLQYLHEKRIIHRDLKGGNILVTTSGCVKLGDFGASTRLLDVRTVADAGANTMTGTPYWMAPEVIRGNTNYGRMADIWSLGICVIEMAAGKPPFSELGPVTALFKIGSTEQRPPYPPDLSTLAAEFLDCCLARDPKKRLSAQELLLHGWIEQGGVNQGDIIDLLPASPNSQSPSKK